MFASLICTSAQTTACPGWLFAAGQRDTTGTRLLAGAGLMQPCFPKPGEPELHHRFIASGCSQSQRVPSRCSRTRVPSSAQTHCKGGRRGGRRRLAAGGGVLHGCVGASLAGGTPLLALAHDEHPSPVPGLLRSRERVFQPPALLCWGPTLQPQVGPPWNASQPTPSLACPGGVAGAFPFSPHRTHQGNPHYGGACAACGWHPPCLPLEPSCLLHLEQHQF